MNKIISFAIVPVVLSMSVAQAQLTNVQSGYVPPPANIPARYEYDAATRRLAVHSAGRVTMVWENVDGRIEGGKLVPSQASVEQGLNDVRPTTVPQAGPRNTWYVYDYTNNRLGVYHNREFTGVWANVHPTFRNGIFIGDWRTMTPVMFQPGDVLKYPDGSTAAKKAEPAAPVPIQGIGAPEWNPSRNP